MKKTNTSWALIAVLASVGFLLLAGTFSTAAASDKDCKDFWKKFDKTAGKYEKSLKKAYKLSSKKNVDIGKLKALTNDQKNLQRTLVLTMERNEKNRDKCSKEWKKVEKEKKKINKLAAKNEKLLAKIQSKKN